MSIQIAGITVCFNVSFGQAQVSREFEYLFQNGKILIQALLKTDELNIRKPRQEVGLTLEPIPKGGFDIGQCPS